MLGLAPSGGGLRARSSESGVTPSTWPSTCSWMTGARGCSGTTSLSRSMLAMHNSQGAARGHGLEGCPPHGPHVVDAVKEGSYVARCLACGLVAQGAKMVEVKLAFDQRWH